MKKKEKVQSTKMTQLSGQEVRQLQGGVYDNGNGGCIPNPLDKFFPKVKTI